MRVAFSDAELFRERDRHRRESLIPRARLRAESCRLEGKDLSFRWFSWKYPLSSCLCCPPLSRGALSRADPLTVREVGPEVGSRLALR
jgi:hypothetical protein